MSALAIFSSGVREKEKNWKCIYSKGITYNIYGKRKYLDRLHEVNQGNETAKLALRKKERRISFDGHQKKNRKCNQKDKSDDKQWKNIMIVSC